MDRTLLFRMLLLLSFLALVSCTEGDALVDPANEAPTWTGVIESGPFTDVPDPPGSVFWVDVNPPGSGLQVGIIVRSATEIVFRDDAGFQPGGAESLQVGQDVRVWSTGIEYFSTPPMVDAARIEVW